MVFSLQKRFFLFLLLPVTLLLVVTGVASFMYARSYLLDEWSSGAKMELGNMAREIQARLDQKQEIIHLIVDAEDIPDGDVTRAYLAERLSAQPGVAFVDIESSGGDVARPLEETRVRFGKDPVEKDPSRDRNARMRDRHRMMHGPGSYMPSRRLGVMSHRGMSVWLDEGRDYLSLVSEFGGVDGKPKQKVTVKVSFESFIKNILEVGHRQGSFACLVNSQGEYLAHTDPTMYMMKTLGETGDPLETQVMKDMKEKHFGTVFGSGHPPDWVVGFYKVPDTDWYLLLFSEGNVVLDPVVRFRFTYLLAGTALLICVGLLILWNTRPVAESVTEISRAAERVEKGDYSVAVSETRTDEIGHLKRRFNKMIEGLRQRDLIERTFGRYVDRGIAQDLMSRPEALHLGGEKRTVTILMADLRGFTQATEKMPPEVVIAMLNRYFGQMITIIDRYRGIIVDFYGDSVLVFFNGLDDRLAERASDAVQCALEMQRRMTVVSEDNKREGLPPLQMGVGIHTGEVIVGNIGSESRAKYGIVGSAVNETDRIQSTARGGSIMISEQTYALVAASVDVGLKCQACLKGLDGVRDLYEIRAVDEEDPS
ncbi:MAG: adenylate/guanylate cyclase domain-containing protein [Desulfomonilaceae bacterium]|nr:adenylate/guanylate cyclase domain-containing protein [Desulfomonilaceae bacterium]